MFLTPLNRLATIVSSLLYVVVAAFPFQHFEPDYPVANSNREESPCINFAVQF